MRRSADLVIVAFVALVSFVAYRQALPTTADSAKGATQQAVGSASPSHGMQDINDLLWLLGSDRQNLSSYCQQVLDSLEDSKVPTVEKAEDEAIRFKLASGGLLAEEGVAVVGLLRIGVELPTFANSGDLVWVVRISHQFRGVTQEMWISSTTGAVRTMLPMQDESK
jgi:hypothetical protein